MTASGNFKNIFKNHWESTLKFSLKNNILGFLILLASSIVLWFNEGRAVKTARSLDEGKDILISIDAKNPDSKNDGKLIYAQDVTKSDETLIDTDFGIEINAIKLRRTVEMYQWEEQYGSKNKSNNESNPTSDTEQYQKVWSSKVINSKEFQYKNAYQNPNYFEYESFESTSNQVAFGNFILPSTILELMHNYEYLPLNEFDFSYYSNAKVFTDKNSKPVLFIGKGTINNPNIGDFKIYFEIVKNGTFSIIAAQKENTLDAFETSNGKTILLLESGNISADEMFKNAHSGNVFLTWVIRILSMIALFFGIKLMFEFWQLLPKLIPFTKKIEELGVYIFNGIIALTFSSIIISLAWIAFRPLIGGVILLVLIGLILALYKKSLSSKN